MADNPSSPDTGARPRPKPTIDLTATEIAPTADASEWSEASAYTAQAEPNAGSPPEAPPTVEAAPDTMQGEPPAADAASAATAPHGPTGNPPVRGGGSLWSHLAAGIAGGALVAAGLWSFTMLDHGPARIDGGAGADATWNSLAARVSSIESQVRALPKQGAGPDAAVTALTQRVAKLESVPAAAPDTALSGRLDQAETTVKAIAGDLAQLHRRADENSDVARQAATRAESAAGAAETAQNAARSASAERQDLDRLRAQVTALEDASKATQAELSRQAAAMPDARVLRLAIAAAALKSAVDAGHSFRAELNAVKSIGPKADLSPLDAFADTGVPPTPLLSRELSDLAPAILRAAVPASDGAGFLDRLESHAKQLVRIRRVDDAPGDDPSTVVGRMELKAAQGDIAGAAAELGKLPPAARAPAESWLRKAQARQAAMDLSRQLETDALAGLARQAS